MKKWIVFVIACIIAAAVFAIRFFPHEPSYREIMEGRTPMFECVVTDDTSFNEAGNYSILVQPVETCEFGNKKDLSSLQKPIRIFEKDIQYDKLEVIRSHLKQGNLEEYVFTVHYKDDASFEEKEDEMILRNIYALTESGRKTDFDKEQCVNCQKGCKAE